MENITIGTQNVWNFETNARNWFFTWKLPKNLAKRPETARNRKEISTKTRKWNRFGWKMCWLQFWLYFERATWQNHLKLRLNKLCSRVNFDERQGFVKPYQNGSDFTKSALQNENIGQKLALAMHASFYYSTLNFYVHFGAQSVHGITRPNIRHSRKHTQSI